jgi:hypothetical protein
MNNFLKARHAHPLEREYEAWIVQGIEQYFTNLGIEFAIWAVSPELEATWPADEKLLVGCKIVGLQFKQAKLGAGTLAFDRLKWSLHSPKGQFELVKSTPEIFYCLPTFVDRAVRSHALNHALFWRPGSATDYNVWYDNPAALTPYNKVRDAMRWGHFMEALLSCTVGVKASTSAEAHMHINRIYGCVREFIRQPNSEVSSTDGELGLYALIFKL